MYEVEKHYKSILDPRTKILLVLTIATVVLGGGGGDMMNRLRPIMVAVPLLLLCAERKWKLAVSYVIVYLAAYFGGLYLLPVTTGILNFIVVAFSGIFSKFLPGIAMGAYLVNTTTVSEFMASMERIHVPQKISIPLSVVFRFFPTIQEEYHSIGDAMRMRGIRFGGGKPSKMVEYRLIPLMVSCVKIGDELSAAALTRGLGAPVPRTNICKIGFHIWDILAFILCIVSFSVLIYSRFIG